MSPRGSVPAPRQLLKGWALDYGYVAYWTLRGLVSRSGPEDLESLATGRLGQVLLIPGVYESWRFLQPIAQHLHREGYPVQVLDQLGYNTGSIPEMAGIVSAHLERLDLDDVVVVAHSKGGLIAKCALREPATLGRVRRVIAINSPFSGSRYAAAFWWPTVRDFAPTSSVVRELQAETAVNRRITSLYSVFDPHIPETGRLEGAENLVLPAIGHFRPIGDRRTLDLISTLIARPPETAPG